MAPKGENGVSFRGWQRGREEKCVCMFVNAKDTNGRIYLKMMASKRQTGQGSMDTDI